jgi:hypothetical protein
MWRMLAFAWRWKARFGPLQSDTEMPLSPATFLYAGSSALEDSPRVGSFKIVGASHCSSVERCHMLALCDFTYSCHAYPFTHLMCALSEFNVKHTD